MTWCLVIFLVICVTLLCVCFFFQVGDTYFSGKLLARLAMASAVENESQFLHALKIDIILI